MRVNEHKEITTMKLKTLLSSGVVGSLFGIAGVLKTAKTAPSKNTKSLIWLAWGLGLASAVVSAVVISKAEALKEAVETEQD